MEINENKFSKNPSKNLDKNFSYYLYEPELKKRHLKAIPNELMYRFFPNEKDIIIKNKNPKDNYRFIFNGIEKTPYEKEKLEEFYKFFKEKNKNNEFCLPDWWIESDTLRFLQSANYDFKKVYSSIKDSIETAEKAIKIIDRRIRFILNYGFLYMYGRDTHFRPIIIVEVNKYSKLIDNLKYSFAELSQGIVYFMNYIVNYILIPGQIENWILICDLKDVGVSQLPQFKKILSVLAKFRCRVFRNYILHLSGFVRLAASSILGLLGNSAKKIIIVENSKLEIIQEYIRIENLQVKYGGTAPDVIYDNDNLFPPVVPSDKYIKDDEKMNINIVTREAYKEMCLKGKPFKPFTINEALKKEWEKEKQQNLYKKRLSMKPSLSCFHLTLQDFIIEFENTKIKNILKNKNKCYNRYKPNNIDLLSIKAFFTKMRNINNTNK